MKTGWKPSEEQRRICLISILLPTQRIQANNLKSRLKYVFHSGHNVHEDNWHLEWLAGEHQELKKGRHWILKCKMPDTNLTVTPVSYTQPPLKMNSSADNRAEENPRWLKDTETPNMDLNIESSIPTCESVRLRLKTATASAWKHSTRSSFSVCCLGSSS